MSMYGGFRGAKIVKAPIEHSLPLATNPRYVSGSADVRAPVSRLGDTRELAEAADQAMQVMNHKENELRAAGVIMSDGRIIYEEEARELGRAVAEGRATIGPTDERGFEHVHADQDLCAAIGYRGDPRAAPRGSMRGDPRAAPGAAARAMHERFATQPNHYQQAHQAYGRQGMPNYGMQQAPQQPQRMQEQYAPQQGSSVLYGDGADARVGDIVQNAQSQILSEVKGVAPGGLRMSVTDIGEVIVPFEELSKFRLAGRA